MVTTVPDQTVAPRPNLSGANVGVGRFEAVWTSDITYLANGQGWFYLRSLLGAA